ncbi:MAG: flagellar hook-length control protein FliK [Methylovirgula sp.]
MNSIAGFLPSLPTRPPSDSYAARSDSETLANSQKGETDGFDAVLSGLSPNSSSDEAATGTAAPVRSSIARMTGEDASAPLVTSEAPSAAAVSDSAAMARSLVAIGDAAGSVPANAQVSANAAPSAAATPSSLNGQGEALPAVSLDAMPPGASVAQRGGAAAAALAASRFGSTLAANKAAASSRQSGSVATTPTDASVTGIQTSGKARAPASAPLPSNSAQTPPAGASSGDNPAQSNLASASRVESVPAAGDASSANIAAISTAGSASGSAASAFAKADAAAASGTAANADAAPTADAAAAIAASLQTAMPVIQGVGTSASKTSRADAAGRSASASASRATGSTSADAMRHAEGADTATASAGIADPTAQAAFVATVAPNSAPEGLPASPDSTPIPGSSQLQVQVQTQAVANGAAASGTPHGYGDSAAASSIAAVERSGAGDSAKMKVTALSSATYFAPVARLSPVQQIADAMIGALPGPSQTLSGSAASGSSMAADATGLASSAASPDPTAALTQSALGPVKTLNLQLEPESLGTVTITLNLSAGGLDVQMAASQSSTMSLIEKDKDALSAQLRQSGYSVAGVAVTLGSHDGSNVANNGSATQGQGGQALSQGGREAMSYGGSSNGNGSAQNNAQNGSEGAAARQDSLGGTADTMASVASGGAVSGDLYI